MWIKLISWSAGAPQVTLSHGKTWHQQDGKCNSSIERMEIFEENNMIVYNYEGIEIAMMWFLISTCEGSLTLVWNPSKRILSSCHSYRPNIEIFTLKSKLNFGCPYVYRKQAWYAKFQTLFLKSSCFIDI